MWRWLPIALLILAAPARARAAAPPVTLGKGPGGLLALAAQDGTTYAVLGRDSATRPLALVTSDGKRKTDQVPFGIPGIDTVDAAPGPQGVQLAFARDVSSELEITVVDALRPTTPSFVTRATAPPQLDDDGGDVAFTDELGEAMLGGDTLTHDAPIHRHVPLDAAQGLVLDLDQTAHTTTLRVLGNADTAPVLELDRREDIDASLSVIRNRVSVAYVVDGRVFRATKTKTTTTGWRITKLAVNATGRPAVAGTHVAYAIRGAIFLDGRRIGTGNHPLMALDGDRLYIGWTYKDTAFLDSLRSAA